MLKPQPIFVFILLFFVIICLYTVILPLDGLYYIAYMTPSNQAVAGVSVAIIVYYLIIGSHLETVVPFYNIILWHRAIKKLLVLQIYFVIKISITCIGFV